MISSQVDNVGINQMIDYQTRILELNRQFQSGAASESSGIKKPTSYFEQTAFEGAEITFKDFATMDNYYLKVKALRCNPTAVRLSNDLNRYIGKDDGIITTSKDFVDKLSAKGVDVSTTLTLYNAIHSYTNTTSMNDPNNSLISAKI